MQSVSNLPFLVVLLCHIDLYTAVDPREDRKTHRVKTLGESEMLSLTQSGNMTHFAYVLDNILVPRVVGTPTHTTVKEFIKTSMNDLGWSVNTDKFSSATPIFGTLEFENIIATLNPNAKRYLVLACHYDSKYFRENNFVGAIDSAVPCAMMINIAYSMKKQMEPSKNQDRLSLKFIFFDGEEAFRRWSPTDSIYGARHLAAKWERTRFPKNNREGTNVLHAIDMIMLLDLLGAPDPVFYSYFRNTDRWYRMLVDAETELVRLGAMKRYSVGKPAQTYFQPLSSGGGIEDDHIPFLQRGVPILHVIPYPFPDVWHTPQDNKNAVDLHTVENLLNIVKLFVTSYMSLEV